jgi:hypothetical protein
MVTNLMLQYSSYDVKTLENTVTKMQLRGFNYRDCTKPVKPVSYVNTEDYLLGVDPQYCSGIGNYKVVMGNNLGCVTTPNWSGIQWGIFYNSVTDLYVLQINSTEKNLSNLLKYA